MPKRSSGLGRGLGSLIPQPVVAAPATNVAVLDAPAVPAVEATMPDNAIAAFHIPVLAVEPNPLQPRKTFDHAALEDMMNSIREHGVMQPITVTRAGEGRYELVAGERRWRASKMLGLETIPAVIRDADTDKKLVLALIENIQRQDLTALEEAKAYEQLINEYGFTQDDVARQMGKARSTVANTLRLLGLPSEIQQAIGSGELAAGTARAILALPDEAAQLAFFHKLRQDAKGTTTREVERRVRRAAGASDPSLLAAEAELRDVFGTRVEIKKRHGQGAVSVAFYSDEEYDRVMGLLRKCGGEVME